MSEANLEDVKKFWNNRPCNIRHSQKEIGSKEYFTEVEKRKYFVEPHIPGFAEFAKWKGKKVLEIGCGIGTDAVNFARSGADYYGVELSAESLNLAKTRFRIFDLAGTFWEGNAEELSDFIPDALKFDLIYSFGVIHHTPHPEQVINGLKKFMHQESELRIMLYSKISWKNIMIEGGFDQPEAASGCPIANTYTENEIRDLLKDYQICSIRKDHIFPYIIEKYIKHEYEYQPWFKHMPTPMFEHLQKTMGWHTLITAKLKGIDI